MNLPAVYKFSVFQLVNVAEFFVSAHTVQNVLRYFTRGLDHFILDTALVIIALVR